MVCSYALSYAGSIAVFHIPAIEVSNRKIILVSMNFFGAVLP